MSVSTQWLVAHAEHHVTQNIAFPARQRLLLHPVGNPAGHQGAERDAAQVDGTQADGQDPAGLQPNNR